MRASGPVTCEVAFVTVLALLVCGPFAKAATTVGNNFLPYITAYQSTYSGIDDEYVGPPISVSSGLPFGNSLHYKAYVGANGIISLSKPFNYYQPTLFPSSRPEIRHSNVIAPFWNDIDVTNVSSVSVGVHSSYNSSLGSENYDLLMSVNSFIQTSQNLNEPFSGKWMLVVTWNSTRMFPSSALQGTPSSLSLESRELLMKENTFQAVVVTNYTSSYAIFTYRCGDLSTPGFQYYSTVGINADNAFSFNHQLSGYEAINTIACANGEFTNLVYELNRDSRGTVEQSDSQHTIAECWNYYVLSQTLNMNSTVPLSEALANLPKCPCSAQQVLYDMQFYVDPDDSTCYISRFYESKLGLGTYCCYQGSQDSGYSSTKPHVSYIRYHPKFPQGDIQLEDAYRSACCGNISLGMCELYYSKRTVSRSQTCVNSFEDPYTPFSVAWSGGGHHIRTPDGLNYTLNGVGEYILITHPRLQFQGRLSPGTYPGTSYFSAFTIRYDSDRVQIEFGTRVAGEFYVGHNDSTSLTLTEISYLYSPMVEIVKHSSNVTVVFADGPSIMVHLLTSGHLEFVLLVKKNRIASPYGLLGNFNNVLEDDLMESERPFQSPLDPSEQEIYNISQTWQVSQSGSLFEYLPGASYSTYSDPSFVPAYLHDILPLANNATRDSCSENILCIFEAVTSGMIELGVDVLLFYKRYETIDKTLSDLPPSIEMLGPSTFNILVTPNSQSCFSVSVYVRGEVSGDGERQNFQLSLHGGIEQFVNTTIQFQTDVLICYTFNTTVLPDVSDFSPMTLVIEDTSSNIVTYTPLINICSCPSIGRCLQPSNSEFLYRIGTVLIQDCVCDSLPEDDILPFGLQEGDIRLPKRDNSFSGLVNLTGAEFPFYGEYETMLYVNYNGMLNFRGASSVFGPRPLSILPLSILSNPLIAPFFHDINTVRGGDIYYRLSNNVSTLTDVKNYLASLYSMDDPNNPIAWDFSPSSVFICTWDQVASFESFEGIRPNTIQVALITDNNSSYVIFIYKDIQWGPFARIGFQSANGQSVFELPYSGLEDTVNMDSYSNVGRKGVFVYRVDGIEVMSPIVVSEEPQRAYDGEMCTNDVDGCSVIDCFNGGLCSDAPAPEPGVYCPSCPFGYTGIGTKCYDIDECENAGNTCVGNLTCVNTAGSYECRCRDGLVMNVNNQCVDIISCQDPSVCGPLQTCELIEGGFNDCVCPDGYDPQGKECLLQDECLAASRNNILDSLCLPHQRCLQRAVMHQVCVCPPFTLKYRGYTAAPECIVHPVVSEGPENFITATVNGLNVKTFFLEGFLDSFIDSTVTALMNYCSTQLCTYDLLIPLSAFSTSPARRKRYFAPTTTIPSFDDIRVVVDFENLNLEQTGNEFDFTFYIEVRLSGDDYIIYETLELLVVQSDLPSYLSALPVITSLTFSILNPDFVPTTPAPTTPPPTTPVPTTPPPTTQTEEPPVTCPSENDPVWWLLFPTTLAGSIVTTESCPQNGTSSIRGVATRLCMFNGEWDRVDTSNCTREDFTDISEMATQVFSNNASTIDPTQVEEIIDNLVVATDSNTTGGSTIFATDLDTTNAIVSSTVTYLLQNAMADNTVAFNEEVLDVISNVLDESNMEGWEELQEDSVGSQQLLLNAEGYGQYVAAALMADNIETGNVTEKTLERDNIVVLAKIIDPAKNITEVLFPENVTVTEEFGSAQTRIPRELLIERGAMNGGVSAINVLFTNLELFLPKDNLDKNVTRPVTQIISTQLLSDLPVTKFETKAQFTFTTQKFSNDVVAENPRCASWNFSGEIIASSWSTEGVNTMNMVKDPDTGVFTVECESNHFTAFAVLMDVTGALNDTSEEIQFALTVVTYVGCSISIFFLFVTIVYLLTYWKELFTKVHYFVHLNLAIALLLGYVVFIAGVDTAVINRGLCVFVAALLHYLFTAVFFWMLCEGIMLYLMLVMVFSELSSKWWLFLILGWGVPLIPVVISVGAINDQYGTDTYCWIAVGDGSRGAIWAFVVPMLVVTVVNVFFLMAALRSVYKQRKSKLQGTKSSKKNIILFKQLFMAIIILLPLLGLTWVFGLLTVGDGALVFAWLFTICNTLQGLFIFIFHVLRSEKVWNAITKSCAGKKDDSTSSAAHKSTQSNSVHKHQSQVGTRVTSVGSLRSSSSFSSETTDMKGFRNPAFESVIQEETTLQDDPEQAHGADLIDVDESMFENPEKEGSLSNLSFGMEPNESDDDRWKFTVTFNWKRNASKESLTDQLL